MGDVSVKFHWDTIFKKSFCTPFTPDTYYEGFLVIIYGMYSYSRIRPIERPRSKLELSRLYFQWCYSIPHTSQLIAHFVCGILMWKKVENTIQNLVAHVGLFPRPRN